MAQTLIDSDLFVRGNFRANSMVVPSGSVGNTQVNPNDPIQPANLGLQHNRIYSQPRGVAAVTERKVVHVGYGNTTRTIVGIQAGLTLANSGAATIVVDLLKNGVSVLSGTITLDSSSAVNSSYLGTVATPNYNLNDVFEISVTATAGGGTLGQGVFALVVFREASQ